MESKNIFNDPGEPAKPTHETEHGLEAVLNSLVPLVQHQEISREKHASPEGEVRLLYLAQGHAICVDGVKVPWMLRTDNDTWNQMVRKDTHPMVYQFDTPLRFDRENFDTKEDAFDYIKIALLRAQIPQEIETLTRELEEKTYPADILKESTHFLQMYKTAQTMLDEAGREEDPKVRQELERKAYLYVNAAEEKGPENVEI